jgi:hypothetical protein
VSFVRRRITLKITLAPSDTNAPRTFSESGTNTVTIEDARASVRIQNSGSLAGSEAQISVWGITPNLMNQLSTLGVVISLVPRDSIAVSVGDDGGAMTTIFIGNIIQAYADYASMPDVPFRMQCLAGASAAATTVAPSSFKGSTSIKTILEALASSVGWSFENSGVDVSLSNPYYSGSALNQIRQIAEHAGINAQVINDVLAIWPKYGARQNLGLPVVAPPPDGNLIGYPNYTQQGLMLRTLFDRRISFGAQIKVQSSLPRANGTWNVLKLDHALDAVIPGGEWSSTIFCYNPGFPALPPRT